MILDFVFTIYSSLFWFCSMIWCAGVGWTYQEKQGENKYKFLVLIPRFFFLALLVLNIGISLLLFTKNIPARLPGYQVGDGYCDYSENIATTGLYMVLEGVRYYGGKPMGNVFSYELCPLTRHCNGKVLSEYSDSKKIIGALDYQRVSTSGFFKLFITLFSILFFMLAVNIPKLKDTKQHS